EGPGVPAGVPGRHGGWALPAPALHRRPGRPGGRAPPLLRGHHPRDEAALHHLCRAASPARHGQLRHALAIHLRDSAGAGRGGAAARAACAADDRPGLAPGGTGRAPAQPRRGSAGPGHPARRARAPRPLRRWRDPEPRRPGAARARAGQLRAAGQQVADALLREPRGGAVKVLILGAGQVGRSAAYHLAREPDNEVTVVDSNEAVLRDLSSRIDVRTVAGNASYPAVLEAAGIVDADMLVALTSSDEVNMVACEIAHALYKTPTKIARIRAPEYTTEKRLFEQGMLAVDVWISPEQLVTEYVERLIRNPGALHVADFADGRARMMGMQARTGGLLVGQQLRTLPDHMPNADARIAAIYRNGRFIAPEGTTVVEEGDE